MNINSVRNLQEALQVLDKQGEAIAILAGGSDLMVQLDRGECRAELLLHIAGISELKHIDCVEGMQVGALVTHQELADSLEGRHDYQGLRLAARMVGGWQTQVVGTVGGNICNASPAADLLPPLLVHGAKITLMSKARGERVLELQEFLLGRRNTARQSDELLTEIILEPIPEFSADGYYKVGRRGAMEVALAGIAVRMTFSETADRIVEIRIATCAVGPKPARALETEAFLKNKILDGRVLSEAGNLLANEVRPIDDIRATADYRKAVVERVLIKAINDCRERFLESVNVQSGSAVS